MKAYFIATALLAKDIEVMYIFNGPPSPSVEFGHRELAVPLLPVDF